MAKRGPVPLSRCESTGSAADFLPPRRTLPQLAKAAQTCRGCDLYCNATQAVFGEGPADATVMFVGEQPGDQEDLAGKPFVGPAGRVLDDALFKVGIDRSETFVTNAVKHFKFEPRGKRRIHSKPSAREVNACKPWLEAEVAVVHPLIMVALGATAAQAILGRQFRVTQMRGKPVRDSHWAPCVIATVHPSSLLRIPEPDVRRQAFRDFARDMQVVKTELDGIKRLAATAAKSKSVVREPGREPVRPVYDEQQHEWTFPFAR